MAVETAAEGEVEERGVTSLFQAAGVTDALLVPAQVGSRPRSLSQHQTVRLTPKKERQTAQ